MYRSLTGFQFRKTSFISIPIMSRRIADRCSDTLFERSSNVFPSCTIQNNCGNFFNLGSRFAKAGRPLGPVYMELGVPMLVWWPRLGRVTRLSIQSLIWSPHLSCKLDQIKMRDYMDRGVTHQHVNRSLNCTMYIICILISDRPLLFWLLLCSHSIFFSS